MLLEMMTAVAIWVGRMVGAVIAGVGHVTLPTILGYAMLLRLMFRGEILGRRLTHKLDRLREHENRWRTRRAKLHDAVRGDFRRALRSGPMTPYIEAVSTFTAPGLSEPTSEDVKNEFALHSSERFGADVESLLDIASSATTWGLFWTLTGLAIGSLSLGLGGGLTVLLLSFSVAVGTSLMGHTVGHRAWRVLRRAEVYKELGAAEAARGVRHFFALPDVRVGRGKTQSGGGAAPRQHEFPTTCGADVASSSTSLVLSSPEGRI